MLPDGCSLIVKELFADQLIRIDACPPQAGLGQIADPAFKRVALRAAPMTEDKSRKSQTACQ